MTESGLLSDDEFAEVARRYVAFCHIDSKVAGNKHPELRTQKKLMGLPSLAFLDAEGAHDRVQAVAGSSRRRASAPSLVSSSKPSELKSSRPTEITRPSVGGN